jgi:hypothetical protein
MQKWEEKYFDREEGREEGRGEATLKHLHTLMRNLDITMEKALEMIEVPKEEWEKYLQQNR